MHSRKGWQQEWETAGHIVSTVIGSGGQATKPQSLSPGATSSSKTPPPKGSTTFQDSISWGPSERSDASYRNHDDQRHEGRDIRVLHSHMEGFTL